VFREILTDCSTPSEFRHTMRCAVCETKWESTATAFSKAGVCPQTEGKRIIFETMYQRERDMALNKAAEEASGVFNRCPICQRFVCDHCFLLCDDLDMCVSCAMRLQEQGEPVMQRANRD